MNRDRVRKMLQAYNHSQVAVIPLLALRYFLALFFVGWVVSKYVHLAVGLLFVIAIAVLFILLLTRRATDFYNRIEERFVTNFYQRQAQNSFQIPESLEKNFLMERMTVTPYSPLAGTTLLHSRLRQDFNVNVVTVERAGKIYDLPEKEMLIMPSDRLTFLGNEDQLAKVRSVVEVEPDMLIHDHSDHEINTCRLEVSETNPLVGITIRDSGFTSKYNAMVIGIEHGRDYIVNPQADTRFRVGDIVWFVSPNDLKIKEFQVLNSN